MDLVRVKAKEGRKAFADAACKQEIPSDKFVTLPMSAHLQRLIDVHKDVEVEPLSPDDPDYGPGANLPAAAEQAIEDAASSAKSKK